MVTEHSGWVYEKYFKMTNGRKDFEQWDNNDKISLEGNKMSEINISEELKKVKEYKSVEWWKSPPGKHTVVFIGDPKEDSYERESGKETPQIVFHIEVKKQSFLWSIPRGKKCTSLWGQLLTVADKNGTFNGMVANIIVTGEGKDKRYTVIEAADIINGE